MKVRVLLVEPTLNTVNHKIDIFINTIKINSMNYSKIYNDIIENAKQKSYDDYTEKHHIIPRSLGGTDEPSNLVILSAREHFICHYLLTKIHKNNQSNFYKMVKAFIMMFCSSKKQLRYSPSRNYEILKKEFAKAQSINQLGSNNSQFGTHWITNLIEDRKHPKHLMIPDGWYMGRKSKYKSLKDKHELSELKKNQAQLQIESKRAELRSLYKIYDKYGFDKLVEITSYKYSKQNLVGAFSKYLPEFIPQNGKSRKK